MPDAGDTPVEKRTACGFKNGIDVEGFVWMTFNFAVVVIVSFGNSVDVVLAGSFGSKDSEGVNPLFAFVDLVRSVLKLVDNGDDSSWLGEDSLEASLLL